MISCSDLNRSLGRSWILSLLWLYPSVSVWHLMNLQTCSPVSKGFCILFPTKNNNKQFFLNLASLEFQNETLRVYIQESIDPIVNKRRTNQVVNNNNNNNIGLQNPIFHRFQHQDAWHPPYRSLAKVSATPRITMTAAHFPVERQHLQFSGGF